VLSPPRDRPMAWSSPCFFWRPRCVDGRAQFDLILMGMQMPLMDGLEATCRIRALPGLVGGVPIIALTADADPYGTEAYLAPGMDEVIEKPIKLDVLQAAMTWVLTGDRTRHAA
jgi:CheY-like chemotaxis protein